MNQPVSLIERIADFLIGWNFCGTDSREDAAREILELIRQHGGPTPDRGMLWKPIDTAPHDQWIIVHYGDPEAPALAKFRTRPKPVGQRKTGWQAHFPSGYKSYTQSPPKAWLDQGVASEEPKHAPAEPREMGRWISESELGQIKRFLESLQASEIRGNTPPPMPNTPANTPVMGDASTRKDEALPLGSDASSPATDEQPDTSKKTGNLGTSSEHVKEGPTSFAHQPDEATLQRQIAHATHAVDVSTGLRASHDDFAKAAMQVIRPYLRQPEPVTSKQPDEEAADNILWKGGYQAGYEAGAKRRESGIDELYAAIHSWNGDSPDMLKASAIDLIERWRIKRSTYFQGWIMTEAPYEVLPELVQEGGEARLAASYTPNNGICIGILNEDQADWAEFHFTPAQAEIIGKALRRWAQAAHPGDQP